jgi:hypothetical protein
MTSKLTTELAARQPWLYAEGESWWVVTGQVSNRHSVTDCIAQVVPSFVTGVDDGDGPALFKVHAWGGEPLLVDATKITRAKRLVFVLADEPRSAFYDDEQAFLEAGAR